MSPPHHRGRAREGVETQPSHCTNPHPGLPPEKGKEHFFSNALSELEKKCAQPLALDAELFRQAVEGTVPLPPSDRVSPAPPPRRVTPRTTPTAAPAIADHLSDHGAGDAPLTEFARSGISRMTLRKLRRGNWPVEDNLDLHGLSSEAARQLLLQFLHEAMTRNLKCVCVIHGKGDRADGGEGILKSRTRHWLTQCAEALAFCEPPARGGGSGAVWVLLKSAG